MKKCDKRLYPDKQSAENAINRLNQKKNWGLKSSYYCQQCKGYHVTRWKESTFKKIKEKQTISFRELAAEFFMSKQGLSDPKSFEKMQKRFLYDKN